MIVYQAAQRAQSYLGPYDEYKVDLKTEISWTSVPRE